MKFAKALLLSALLGLPMAMSAQEHLKSLDKNGLDPAVSASQDFYQHVNKGWMEANPLTPE